MCVTLGSAGTWPQPGALRIDLMLETFLREPGLSGPVQLRSARTLGPKTASLAGVGSEMVDDVLKLQGLKMCNLFAHRCVNTAHS